MTKQQIWSLLNEGKAQEAKALCLELCEQDQTDVEAWVYLGASHLQLGDVVNAEKAGRKAIEMNQDGSPAWNLLIQSFFRQGKTADAIQGIRELIRLNPQSGQPHRQLAEVLLQQKDFTGAVGHYRKAIDFGEHNSDVYIGLGDSLQGQGDFSGAIEQYQFALKVEAGSVRALICLGNSCMALGRWDQAADAYEQALRIGQPSGVIHHNLGEAYQNQARLNEAEANYREAIRLCPGLVEPNVNLGRNLQKLGRLDEAMACHKQALSIDPRFSAAHHNIALCVYNDQDLSPAAESFRAAIELNPANGLAKCFLGIICLQRGDDKIAEVIISTAQQQDPFTACIVESYQYAAKAGPDARYFSTTSEMLKCAIDSAKVDGMFLEFGVCHGTSINIIANRTTSAVHGFDSFEGLPESWQVGAGMSGVTEQAGAYTTKGNLPNAPDNVTFHVGVFEDTLPGFVKQHSGPVSFINMDCDLYSSTDTVFQYLGERVVPGSVIVFDEYFCYPEWKLHEFKAFQEFVVRFNVSYEYLAFSYFTGQAVVRILEIG